MDKKSDILSKIGIRITIERKKLKLSQEKLAELANLNRNSIGMIERGETNITVGNLEKIAIALGINIKDLFDFTL